MKRINRQAEIDHEWSEISEPIVLMPDQNSLMFQLESHGNLR